MVTDSLLAEPSTLWQRLADDEGNGGDLMVVVAILTVAGALAGAIAALSSQVGVWAANLSETVISGLTKARGGK